ncbi:MAG: YbbR-like domain-containing protein [Candidatus Dormibacteria bacterium]
MRLPGVFTRNVRLKLLAAGLAVLTWGTIVYAGNPPDTRTVAVHVSQDPASVPPQFVLLRPIEDVRLRIVGTRDHLNAFDVNDLSVRVAFDRIRHSGTQQVPITVANRNADVDIDNAPTSVTAALDDLGSTAKPVEVELSPPLPRGYLGKVAGTTPPEVTVTGPQHQLERLQARVVVDMSQQRASLEQDFSVQLFVGGRQVSSDFGVSPTTVHVSVAVTPSLTSRATVVIPDTTGVVGSGHQLVGIRVDPPTVLLSGPLDRLNASPATVATDPISLSGLTVDHDVTVAVLTPSGLRAVPATVTVHISIDKLSTPVPSPSASP